MLGVPPVNNASWEEFRTISSKAPSFHPKLLPVRLWCLLENLWHGALLWWNFSQTLTAAATRANAQATNTSATAVDSCCHGDHGTRTLALVACCDCKEMDNRKTDLLAAVACFLLTESACMTKKLLQLALSCSSPLHAFLVFLHYPAPSSQRLTLTKFVNQSLDWRLLNK